MIKEKPSLTIVRRFKAPPSRVYAAWTGPELMDREVQTDSKLVFTWEWVTMPERRSLVTIHLRAIEEGTEMNFTHSQFFDEAARDGHEAGWSGAFEKLDRLIAELASAHE